METEKLFYADPFLTEFDAKVLACEAGRGGFDVVLDRTAFYPEGGGQPGDLIIVFKIEPHKIFVRNGFDLQVDLPISFKTAALGGTVKVPAIDDTFDFTIPEGTQNGQLFTVRGRGIRSARGATGNLILRILVEVPTRLTRDQKREIEAMDSDLELKQYDKMKKFSDNVESFYGKKPY